MGIVGSTTFGWRVVGGVVVGMTGTSVGRGAGENADGGMADGEGAAQDGLAAGMRLSCGGMADAAAVDVTCAAGEGDSSNCCEAYGVTIGTGSVVVRGPGTFCRISKGCVLPFSQDAGVSVE